MSLTTSNPWPDPDSQQNGISRSNALGRILHFEALMRRRMGEVRPQRYVRLHNYYAGQNLPPDNVDQPLMINYFKSIIDKHTSYLWGQWEKQKRLFTWRVTPVLKDEMSPEDLDDWTQYGRKIKRFLDKWYDDNKGNQLFWAGSKNGCLYGDSVIEVRYDERQRRVIAESVLPEYFHAMWEISNMENLTEVIVAYPIDRVVALEQYGTTGNDKFIGYQAINPDYMPGIGVLWKRWSPASYQVWVDDTNVINMPNPYMPVDDDGNLFPGLIPFIHVRNMPAGSEYFGYSDGENMLFLSDELNRRFADAGDITNVHAHPIITLTKFTGDTQDLPVGPDAVWDLGREGEAKRLEGTGPGPDTMGYLDKVKEAMHETANMPPAAFGTQKGGTSHNSGLALAMAMMPVTERAKEKRIHWHEALKELPKMIFYQYWVRDNALLGAFGLDYARVRMFDIEPIFADILPKEELQVVNEAVATYSSGLKSLQRSLELLGEDDVETEMVRIKADMLFKASVEAPTPPGEGGSAGQNSDSGMGGSSDVTGGVGAGADKPGTLIKSDDQDKPDATGLGATPD